MIVCVLGPGPIQNRLMLGWIATCAIKAGFAIGFGPQEAYSAHGGSRIWGTVLSPTRTSVTSPTSR